MKNHQIGKIGEDKAMKYMEKLKYLILERNYREKFGEIDLIAVAPDRTLIFVEVKTMEINDINILKPEDNFTTHKSQKVKRMAEYYAAGHPELIDEDMGWRIDVIAVEISLNGTFIVRHYENI